MHDLRAIAFYLPQYHPIPENDRWWGRGFTEWTNVTRARPLFRGHYQPHLPADLGFYDLRLPEARAAQAELAREYGLHGFCYYHYWFGGRRLLERPFAEVLASGEPDFPFCLCWANERWTRAWDGRDGVILVDQGYSDEDDVEHIRWLARAFRDERYIRVGGRPLFLVYRASQLPDAVGTTRRWRDEARRLGVGELFLCRVESSSLECDDPRRLGFDAAVEFQPDWSHLGPPKRRSLPARAMRRLRLTGRAYGHHRVYDYATVARRMLGKADPAYLRFPCVTPSWDNSPRRESGAIILADSTPALYEAWLSRVAERVGARDPEERILFINGWNEWAEGNHLEPDQRFGLGYLEATRRALRGGGRGPVAGREALARADRPVGVGAGRAGGDDS